MDKVTTPEFRVSFPAVFEPVAFQGGQPKYSVTMLFPKGTNLDTLKALAKAAVQAKWPDPNKRPKSLQHPFRDGDKDKPDLDGYAGHIFVKATSKMRPGVIDSSMSDIITPEDFYAGCYAKASITAYAYDTAGNRGVAFGLQNLMKTRDGEPFSGRSSAQEDFADEASAGVTQQDLSDVLGEPDPNEEDIPF